MNYINPVIETLHIINVLFTIINLTIKISFFKKTDSKKLVDTTT